MNKTVIEHINNAERTLFSFELLPPLKGQDFSSTERAIDPLMEFKPSFINITYHQEEAVYENLPGGLIRKHTVRKRPGTVGIAAAIRYRYQVNVVPHIICGGFTKEDTENALIDLQFLGINNILALRGDPPEGTKIFVPEMDGNEHALDLIQQINNLNHGIYLDSNLKNTRSMNFCIGVAGYPEKHIESPNMDSDLYFLKKKIDAGASYIVSQMFYDNKKFFEFEKLCREKGITVPIIPGIKPISTKEQMVAIPKTFNVDLPVDLVKEIIKCKDNTQVRQVGVEWAIAQSRELIDFGVPVLHYYSMGKTDNIQQIAKAVF
jgi:methylenetetrahydrofolate reductase (NADPH)